MQGKIYSVQALRGLGALAVVVYHALTIHPVFSFHAGAAGVDLFFTISGVVMALSIKEGTKPLYFLGRRAIRIIPMYWIATSIALLYVIARYEQGIPLDHAIASYFFLPPGKYLFPLLYQGWTLNFELFFYFLLSIIILFTRSPIPVAICVLVLLGSLAEPASKIVTLYYINDRLLEFAAGLTIGVAMKHGLKLGLIPSVFLIVSSIVIFAANDYFRQAGFIAWGGPSAMLVVGMLHFDNSTLVRSRPVQLIGEASYSIYLFHAIAIWLLEWTFPQERTLSIVFGAIALSIALGIIMYLALERPIINFAKPTSRKSFAAAI